MQIQNNSCVGGEEISGWVYINLTLSVPPSTLSLVFKGKEKTTWEDRYSKTYNEGGVKVTREVTKVRRGKKPICSFTYPLYTFTSDIYPGGFSLPFTFRLPQNVPGSFAYSSGPTAASVSYKLSAKLMNSQNMNLKGCSHIKIRQPDYNYRIAVEDHKEAKMSTWCCINKGICRMHVSHRQNSYTPSQRADFTVHVDNTESKLTVQAIQASLVFSMLLKDKKNRTKFVKESIIKNSVCVNIPSGSALLASSGMEMSLDFLAVKGCLDERYTTKGEIIEGYYTIVVEAYMDGNCMCCGDSPTVVTPMFIAPDACIYYQLPPAPPGWNPTVLQQQNIEYQEWVPRTE